MSSPPPTYNFPHIPYVTSAEPLWEHRERMPVMRGLSVDKRELVLTTVLDARPDVREPVPRPSLWPFISSIAVGGLFIASIFSPWGLVIGAVPVAIALIGWFWPKGPPAPGDEDPEP
jgi:hypothetical protein